MEDAVHRGEVLIWRPRTAEESASLLAWAEHHLPGLRFAPALSWAFGVVRDAHVIAAVIYTNYHPGHMIEIGVVSVDPRWCTRQVLGAAFAYPFRDLNVRRLQATTARRNKRARRLIGRLGFKFEGTARQGWPAGGDASVYSMLRRECRWLEERTNGKEHSITA